MLFAVLRRRWFEDSPRAVRVFLSVVIMLIIGVVAAMAHATWRADMERATSDANNLAVMIEQDIRRNIELYDLSIQGARDSVMDPSVMAAPRELRDRVLFDRASAALYLGEMMVLDADGAVIASSRSDATSSPSNQDRDYFRIHMLVPDFGLYVSRPLVLRPGEEPAIALSRRITRRDGSFGGVIVGTLRTEYLRQLFQRMRLGENGAITLYRNDGTVMMREPFNPTVIGQRRMSQVLIDLASRSPEGEYQSLSPVDGKERLYHYRRLLALPLVVNVGLSVQDIHKDWWVRMLLAGTVVTLCCGAIIVVTLRLGRELRRRMDAEAALLALVDTDGLTGLANRRCFDRVLDEAWRRTGETGAPLSLLMIDADRFKAFNDLFGHAAGDEVLREIGRCLGAHAQRPGELAARFGGEEFAMVLPGLARPEAMQLADTVRRSIEHLGIEHPAASSGLLTISIGCACASRKTMRGPEDLVASADAALYRSKRGGRNAVNDDRPASETLPLAS